MALGRLRRLRTGRRFGEIFSFPANGEIPSQHDLVSGGERIVSTFFDSTARIGHFYFFTLISFDFIGPNVTFWNADCIDFGYRFAGMLNR